MPEGAAQQGNDRLAEIAHGLHRQLEAQLQARQALLDDNRAGGPEQQEGQQGQQQVDKTPLRILSDQPVLLFRLHALPHGVQAHPVAHDRRLD